MQCKPIEVSDSKYRWRYEMSLFKNPTVFLAVVKALLIALGITVFIIGLITLIADGFSKDGFIFLGKLILLLTGILAVLLVLGYLLYAAIMGGKYIVDFEMDDKKLVHAQIPEQAKKAEDISGAAVVMGVLAKNRGAVSAGMLSSGRNVSVTEFKDVKKGVVDKKHSVIKISYFGWNEVYADGDDFDFVAEWIRKHIPETAEWVVK